MTDSRPAGSIGSSRAHRPVLVRSLGAAVLAVSVLSLVTAAPASARTSRSEARAAAAAGSSGGGIAASPVLTPTGGGTWSVVASPNASDPANQLNAVTCVSDSDCWAVGQSNDSTAQSGGTLIEHWNGATWSTVPSPGTATGLDIDGLDSITCVSASDCWAVGSQPFPHNYEPFEDEALIEQWDGSSWSIVPAPPATYEDGTLAAGLTGITCVSSTDCWAVGDTNFAPDFLSGTIIEHWDGSAWSVGHIDIGDANLASVTCTDGSDCWAVGHVLDSASGMDSTFTEHWDGSTWSVVPSPNFGSSQVNGLTSVSCVPTSGCWAVGYYYSGVNIRKYPIYQNLGEHWDGSTWSVAAIPDSKPNQRNSLESVTCTATTECWAVGSFSKVGGLGQTSVLQWDGSVWSAIPSQSVTDAANGLSSVSCTAALDCWSVGFAAAGSVTQTLIERLMPTAVVVTPSSGPTGTAVAVSGSGFPFGKDVKVTYFTGAASGRQSFTLCSTTAGADGSFSCFGSIPSKNVGAPGPHTVEATGPKSLQVASTTFDLT
jgi:hypothetical protein